VLGALTESSWQAAISFHHQCRQLLIACAPGQLAALARAGTQLELGMAERNEEEEIIRSVLAECPMSAITRGVRKESRHRP
jgi:hypothetical protein